MEYRVVAEHMLHEMGICSKRNGYGCILSAMNYIDKDRETLHYVTKTLYIDLAKEFCTTPKCVEKNIRTVVNRIWECLDINRDIVLEIFGKRYLRCRPSNAEFLELFYDYVKNFEVVEVLENIECPYLDSKCALYCKSTYRKAK